MAANTKFTYSTKVEGQNVVLTHVKRRRYSVTINGKKAGDITARDAVNAIQRVEGHTIKELKASLLN